MFSRNNQLSHSPSSSWACYTSAGAQAAGSSNIALSSGSLSLADPGAIGGIRSAEHLGTPHPVEVTGVVHRARARSPLAAGG